jgi:hypothetical protein
MENWTLLVFEAVIRALTANESGILSVQRYVYIWEINVDDQREITRSTPAAYKR